MKKIIYLLIAAFTFLVIPIAVFSQTTPPGGDVIDLPPLPIPITFDFSAYVATFFLFAATVVFLTSLINRFLTLKGFAKQYLSWFVAILVGVAGLLLHLGIFATVHWYQALIYALAAGLGANGIFDWALIQKILIALNLEKPEVVPLK